MEATALNKEGTIFGRRTWVFLERCYIFAFYYTTFTALNQIGKALDSIVQQKIGSLFAVADEKGCENSHCHSHF